MTDQELRTYAFISIISFVILWEFIANKRPLKQRKFKRWLNNFGLIAVDTVVVKLLLPAGAFGVALWAENNGYGLLNNIDISPLAATVVTVIILDMIIYWQHRLFHVVPMFWRLHQVHHADRDIDVSTGLRFHPIEIILSMLIKFVAVITLGAPAAAVVLFEVILNGMAMFNHGNIRMPKALDSLIRLLFVTPDMHRVHHSIFKHETNSNYGFNLSIWDKIFGSYHAQPDLGHDKMTIGLQQYQGNTPTSSLLWMLKLPFTQSGGMYAQKDKPTTKETAL
ncbi:sterol desaturase family protein [Ghiorsea bivora]|uniref:sterol desaturase family protein n=1 Tax=Ghiorsea bivora TaxID=1485545 RepID=UPI0006916CE5|nr:sterol desaturase family protein [Ghiorsea bivora]